MKRAVFLLVAALAAFLVGRAIVHSLASDETRIRWVIEDMAEGFDGTRMDPILRGLARDYLDESSGADRDTLRQALAYLFFTAKEETTKRFPYRVEVTISRIATTEEPDGKKTASCEMTARFLERAGEEEELAWEVEGTAQLKEEEGDWRIRRTSHATRAGSRLR